MQDMQQLETSTFTIRVQEEWEPKHCGQLNVKLDEIIAVCGSIWAVSYIIAPNNV